MCSVHEDVTTYECDGVARGQDDDVGARDDAGALRLELRLGVLDDVHPAEPLVLVVVHLRVVAPALDQHRRVAPLRSRGAEPGEFPRQTHYELLPLPWRIAEGERAYVP